ncbi:MAG: hypothetical protein JSU65_12625 [Candidatus Zixiibacteriota bacterium]|nr:MAG: hypothetical protein JSU65_12625 [candidate division Zixibacteria bacterium]
MLKKTFMCLILVAVVIAGVSAAYAQGGERDRTRTELERTDQILERAREAVYASPTPNGEAAMGQATRLREASWESFTAHMYGQAMEQTKAARQYAEQAIAAGRSAEENGEMVQRRLEHAAGLLERVRENAPDDIPHQFRALWRTAEESLQRARQFYNEGQYRPALKLSNQAEKAARKIAEAFQGRDYEQKRFQRRFEEVDNLIVNTREIVAGCGSDKAAEMLQQSIRLMNQAGELDAKGQIKGAREMLQKAFQMANRAAGECRGKGEFLDRLERVQAAYEALVDKVEPDDTEGQELLAQISEQLDLASQAYESGDLDAANAALRAAWLTIRQLRLYLQTDL